ncbi:MAG: prolipoprotein diacylglyceryl transferase [Nitrospirae bacterium]|nr:prolipoprotein diacylglyceryl transferase [Nitrospirota bacterium]MCL5977775.1 prolipoprotein diacylglyceryl transferase [Nitrospirota bacterium]
MIPYPNISPEIIRIGPVAVRWYGMMYLIGFAASYLLVRYQIKKKGLNFSKDFVESLYSYLILGLLLGARLGYVIFYNLPYYIRHPLEVFAVWQGGMSFHGGLIGSVIAGVLFCKRLKIDAWQVSDMVIVTAPIGIGLGRLGNFINGELYGRVTDAPWAMIFPGGGPFPRHPSQLYEFFLEGVVLFTVLWALKEKGLRTGMPSSIFLILYGAFRFFVEFFREPDVQIGYILGVFTMGQILSGMMMLFGFAILFYRRRPVE